MCLFLISLPTGIKMVALEYKLAHLSLILMVQALSTVLLDLERMITNYVFKKR